MKKQITLGVVAHVDSGKTTLIEALLYNNGRLRQLGRVDRRDSFLDNNSIERDRGITVFSKQATLSFTDTDFTLVDTPGHTDFGAEAERTLSVLDYAILVVSAPEGVQSHTRTLWSLLERYSVPTFVFVNKTDICHTETSEVMEDIRSRLSENCIDFSDDAGLIRCEELAMCSEAMMNEYLEGGILPDSINSAIKQRKVFPVLWGSALKNLGVDKLMDTLSRYTIPLEGGDEFGARVFKITTDTKGTRLTHVKITSGCLRVKSEIQCADITEKINEIRIYSGSKYESVPEAYTGMICALTGPDASVSGMGLGCEKDSPDPILEPVFCYNVVLPSEISPPDGFEALKKLSMEETGLNASWNPNSKTISVQLMGEIQTEVITRVIKERYGFDVKFEKGSVLYKETIANMVEGVGHYEPLRHYAEVHLILSPGKRGSGITFDSKCSPDTLATNWQRLVLTHLAEKNHLGVLTGSPITDIRITLASGKAHLKHTDGGDFRQATYRAVRHGLANAQSVLLEPWYNVVIEVPSENIGRVINDISNMGGSFSPPETKGEVSILNACAPVRKIQFYHTDILSFTRGLGSMSCSLRGYEPCLDADEITEAIGYDFESDTENSADSVFCAHGAAYNVKWHQVYQEMHLESVLKEKNSDDFSVEVPQRSFDPATISQDEIDKIFEMTFGKPKPPKEMVNNRTGNIKYRGKPTPVLEEYILVDGYNIIFSWEELKNLAEKDIGLARERLITQLVNYAAVKDCRLAVVFDAYKVKEGRESTDNINGISVVYTKEAETADAYIERTSHTLAKNYRVRVATSDSLEQIIIIGAGALKVSAAEFQKEVTAVEKSIQKYISKNSQGL